MRPIEILKLSKTSDTVFIIGGGSSLSKYLPDPSILNGKDIICCNNAYQIYPEAMLCYFTDIAWWRIHKEKLRDFKGHLAVSTNGDRREYAEYGIKLFFYRGIETGISQIQDKLNGSNTGHIAINIAYLMGYKNVILLGFDMDAQNEATHWHNQHPHPTNRDRYTQIFLPGMQSIEPYQEKLGFKVWNINKESSITCFDFADLETFI